ncbi:MAG: LamG-like jellyroll fold domain-containing protein [Paludibacter sp.]
MKKIFLLFAISALFQLTAYSVNNAFTFANAITSYASAANNAALNVTAGHSVTITCWVKTASGNSTAQHFIYKRAAAGTGAGFELFQTATGYFGVTVYNSATTPANISPANGTLYKINDGNWHHVAYVLDVAGLASSIYVDGKLEKTSTITSTNASKGITNTLSLFFGIRATTTKTNPLNGSMDEVRIYDMAMTPANLLTDMATTVTSGTTSLSAAWNFNEGTGSQLADIKTTNPATIAGTLNWTAITLATPTAITMAATLSKTGTDADFSPASATPTAIQYTSSTAAATIVNGNVHIAGGGTAIITASQPANLMYTAGTDVTSVLTVIYPPYCVIASTVSTDGPYGLLNGTVSVNGVQKFTLTPYSTPNWKFSDEAASKFTVNRGQTITLNVNGGVNTPYGDAYAYCDWNGDGVFNTADERTAIYINNGAQATGKTLTFTVPQTAVLGDIAMRIKADESPSFGIYTPGDPCSNMKNGTVHTIRFTVAATVVTPAALTFPNDINTYASAADNAALNVTAGHSVTITAWVKTTSATNQMFVCKRVNGDGDGYELYQSGAYFAVNAFSSGTDISPAVGTLYPINDGNWHHVAYVLNVTGTTSSIYVDGKLEKTLQITAGQAGAGITNTDALYFGVRNTTTKTLPLNGSLDEVRIYDKAMTPADLLSDMAVTAAVGTANLTAAWDFNEGSGTTLADVKSTNPATITGSVTWPLITAVAPHAITMGLGLGKLVSDADFSPASATPTAISYSSSNTSVATLVNGKIHIVGVGASNITASQATNLMYTTGTNVTTVLNVYASSSYCVIASSASTDLGYGLNNGTVSVGGVTKYTLPTNVGGTWQYIDGASQFTVNRGTTITLTVNGNSNTAYGDGYVFFDWNNDGAFNTSDERNTIYTNNGSVATNKVITITVPLTAVLGTIAMRLKADEAPSFNGYTPGDPCSNMKNGTCNTIKFTIAAVAQTITFGAITARTYGDADFTLAATASSSLAVSYVSSDPTVATVDAASGLVHILKAGTTTITASQAGDAWYAAATPVGQLLTVNKIASSITATGTTAYAYNASPQGPGSSTVTGSTGAVSYSYVGVSGTIYTASATKPTAAGSYTVTASVAADAIYAAASSSALGFSIGQAASSITATGLTAYTYNASPQGPGTSTVTGSTGAVSYSYASVDGTTYPASATKPTLVGSYAVTASVAADANYNAASSSALGFSIEQAASSITATGTTAYAYNASPQGPGTSTVTGSTGAVSYSYASVDGTTYPASATKPTVVGSYNVIASVAADANYTAASSAALAFSIDKAVSSITVTGTTSFTYTGSGQGPDTSTKTGSTGAVSYSYASVDGTTYPASATKPSAVGYYTVTASLTSDVNYNAANSSVTAFTIALAVVTVDAPINIDQLVTAPTSDVIISFGGTLTINTSSSVNNITVEAGGKLTLASGKSLTVLGALTLQSNAVNGTATFLDNGGTLTAGTTNVQQYLTTGRNWYISSPVSGAYSSVFNTVADANTNKLYSYDETQGSSATLSWPQIKDNGTSLAITKGYVANVDASLLTTTNGVTFSGGSLNTGDITTGVNGVPALSYSSDQYKAGFNLVGNPYPSYLNWNGVSKINLGTNTIWYRTNVGGSYYFYTYNSVDGAAGIGISVPAGDDVSNFIPPMQAFWVKAGASGSSLTFHNTNRGHKDLTNNKFRAKSEKSSSLQLARLQVSNAVNSDETVLYSYPNATNQYDSYDSPKMSNGSASIPEIYTLVGGEKLVINGMNTIPFDTEIPLGFTTGQTGTNFSIKASQVSNFDTGTRVILKDYQDINNPVIADLSDGSSYVFSSGITTNNSSRFALIFKAPSIATGINPNAINDLWISTNANGQIIINGNTNAGTTIDVYNAVGQKLVEKLMTSSIHTITGRLTPGVYVVTIKANANKTTKKLIIN